MSQTTPRASHSSTPYVEDEGEYSEDDEEYVDVDTWFTWFKTTEHYKELQKPALERSGKQEPELAEIAPLE